MKPIFWTNVDLLKEHAVHHTEMIDEGLYEEKTALDGNV